MGSVEKRLDISLNTELQVPSVLSTDFWLAVTAQVKRGGGWGREAGAQIGEGWEETSFIVTLYSSCAALKQLSRTASCLWSRTGIDAVSVYTEVLPPLPL